MLFIKTVIQRVTSCEVKIEGVSRGNMNKGLMILCGVGFESTPTHEQHEKYLHKIEALKPQIEKIVSKIINMRIFSDEQGKLNLNVLQVGAAVYCVSQFSLFADCEKGNRPSFTNSAKPILAQPVYDIFVDMFKNQMGDEKVFTGVFAADMKISLVNDGPLTFVNRFPIKIS